MKTFAIFNFYLKKNKGMLFFILGSFLLIGFMTAWGKVAMPMAFTNFWDALFGLLGVLLTVGLTIIYAAKEWRDSLEKRLTVHFEYKGKYIMTCHEAYLASEGDIRAWGQQIGFQMTNKTQLDFYPYLSQKNPETAYDTNLKIHFMKYEVTFHLRTIETQVKQMPDFKTQYLVWWENTDKTSENQFVWFKTQPTKPATIQEVITEKEK